MNSFVGRYNFRPIENLYLPLGAEVEYWLTDPNGELQKAHWGLFGPTDKIVVHSGREGSEDMIIPELPVHQLELVTAIAADVAELGQSLARLDKELNSMTRRYNLWFLREPMPPRVVTAKDIEVYPKPRYEDIKDKIDPETLKHAWIAGLHLHLGVKSWKQAKELYTGLRTFLPFLMVISVRDPRRFESYMRLMELLERQVVPPAISTDEHFEFLAVEHEFHNDPTSCWWFMRFNPKGTVELRLFDTQEDTQAVLELAAVVRVLGSYILQTQDDGITPSNRVSQFSCQTLGGLLRRASQGSDIRLKAAEQWLQNLVAHAHTINMLPERDKIIQLIDRKGLSLGRVSQLVA